MVDADITFKGIGHVGKAGSGTFKMQPEQLGWRNNEPNLPESTVQCLSSSLVSAEWRCTNERGKYMLKLRSKDAGSVLRFNGFKNEDAAKLKGYLKKHCGLELQELSASAEGHSWGNWSLDAEGDMRLLTKGKVTLDLPLAAIDRVAAPNKNSLNVTLVEEATQPGDECLHEIRFWMPGAGEPADLTAEELAQQLASRSGVGATGEAGERVPDVFIVAPRGRHDFEFCSDFVKIHGKSQNYTVRYQSIKRVYFLSQLNEGAFIFLQLVDPLVSGKQMYHNVVLSFDAERKRIRLDWTEEQCKAYGQSLLLMQEGIMVQDLMVLHFKFLGKKDVTLPGNDFVNEAKKLLDRVADEKCYGLKCMHKTNAGRLFFLKQSLIWCPKNAFLVKYSDIKFVEMDTVRKNGFDLAINTDRESFEINQVESKFRDVLLAWFQKVKVKVKALSVADAVTTRTVRATRSTRGKPSPPPVRGKATKPVKGRKDESEDDDEEDEDYEGSPSGDDSESDEEFVSEEEKPKAKKPRKK